MSLRGPKRLSSLISGSGVLPVIRHPGLRSGGSSGVPAGRGSMTGTERLLQDSLNDQDRSTNTLTLGPSPRGRWKCKTALHLLPLPQGEGWGEGAGIAATLNRGTRGTLCRALQQFPEAGPTRFQRSRDDRETPITAEIASPAGSRVAMTRSKKRSAPRD